MASGSFKGDKLVGRTNYIEWLNNATLFLEINGFMSYIDGSEASPIKSLYYNNENKPYSPELAVRYIEKESEFLRNSKKALGAIKSIISIDNIERFKDKSDAKALWEAIKATYGESNLELIGRYLNRIIDCHYNAFNSIDEYTSQIQSSSLYLKELGYELPRPFMACILFKGLPSSFDSFASRKYEELAKDLANIDISRLISDLISEEARMTSNIDLEANKTTGNPICRYCKKSGHLEATCYKKHPKLKPNNLKTNKAKYKSNKDRSKKGINKAKEEVQKELKTESSKAIMSAFSTLKEPSQNKPVLDSGATEHYSPKKEWLINYKEVYNKTITIADGSKVAVKGIGNMPIKVKEKNILIKNVYYIPTLHTTLISSKELTNKGWVILFKGNKAIISYKKYKLKIDAI
jgi:gag-polypeptide of LTR copia-type